MLNAVQVVAPAAAHQGGLPLAVAIALSVTALVALGMVISRLRRTSRLSPATGGLSAASAAGAVVISLALGYVLSDTAPAPAAASVPFTVNDDVIDAVHNGTFQLETLSIN